MSTLTINLGPQKEQLVEGFKYYLQVYFRINIPGYDLYKVKDDAVEAAVAEYYAQCADIFTQLGWTLKRFLPDRGICPTYAKGNREMYCHPMNISGAATAEEIAEIEQKLSTLHNCRLYKTDITGYVYDITEAEISALIAAKYPNMDKQIEAATTTKRSNLYKAKSEVIYHLVEGMDIKTTTDCIEYKQEYQFVSAKIEALIASGKLIAGSSTEHGDLIRWYNKKEQQKYQMQHKSASQIALF